MKKSTNYLKMTWMALALFVVQPDLPAMSNGHGNTDSCQAATSKARTIQLPFQLAHKLIVVEGRVENNSGLFLLDTGAELNILDRFVRKKVLEQLNIKKPIHLTGATQNQVEAMVGILNQLHHGRQTSHNMRTSLTSLDHVVKSIGYQLDGFLGYEFLRNKRTLINYKKKLLFFYK